MQFGSIVLIMGLISALPTPPVASTASNAVKETSEQVIKQTIRQKVKNFFRTSKTKATEQTQALTKQVKDQAQKLQTGLQDSLDSSMKPNNPGLSNLEIAGVAGASALGSGLLTAAVMS